MGAERMAFESLILKEEIQRISQSKCDLVHGFIRENDKTNNRNTPDGIIKTCLLFAFKNIIESKILTYGECEELHQMIGKQRNIYPTEWKLLYRGSRDGYKIKQCHSKCYNHSNVVLIVESEKGNVFGGFTEIGWDLQAKNYEHQSDPNAFLFLIRSKSHSHKHGIFKLIGRDKALYHFGKYLFMFGKQGY